MKTLYRCYLNFTILIILLFPFFEVNAQIKRSSSNIPVGNASYDGFARMDKMLYQLDLGGGTFADIYIKFCSNPTLEPKYLGLYWAMPFFDSHLTIDSALYKWRSPNDGLYSFRKSAKPDNGFSATYNLTTNGSWKLNVAKNHKIYITKPSDKSISYVFNADGFLSEFCSGNGCDKIRINYGKNGYPTRVFNITTGKVLIDFKYASDLLESIIFAEEKTSVSFNYADVSTLMLNGKRKKEGKSLSDITYIDGDIERYKYVSAGSNDRRRFVHENTESVSVPTNRLIQVDEKGEEIGYIEWDATTGLLTEDSGGEYTVMNNLIDKHQVSDKTSVLDKLRGRRAYDTRVAYKKPENKYPQVYGYNLRTAIKRFQNPNTGEETKYSYIGSPGPASMKVRKIEKRQASESDWKMTASRIYDDKGNLIRELDGEGNLKEFVYDKVGNHLKTLINGEIAIVNEYDKGKLNKVIRFENKNKIEKLYNTQGNPTKVFKDGVLISEKIYDDKGRLKIHRDNNAERKVFYGEDCKYEVVTFPSGKWEIYKKDIFRGNLTKFAWYRTSEGNEGIFNKKGTKVIKKYKNKNFINDDFLNLILGIK